MSEQHNPNQSAVTDEDGHILSNDDLADLLSTEDKVEFWIEKLRRGQVVKRAKVTLDVDTDGITSGDLATYRREIAANAVEQEKLREEAKELGFLDEKGHDTPKGGPEKPRLMERLGELQEAFTRSSAKLLGKMVVSGPIGGKDLSDPDVLCEREGIGPVAREALYDYFFGVWDEPEAETGTSEAANTGSASASSEATETEAIVPATS